MTKHIPPISLDYGSSLAIRAVERTRAFFKQPDVNHDPSDNHWDGLSQIAGAIEAMANGTADRFYLSSLPPGMGKTTIALNTVAELMDDNAYPDRGVIFFFSRKEEIKRMVDELVGCKVPHDEIAVLTSDDKFNRLGLHHEDDKGGIWPRYDKAQILLTTQEKLTRYCRQYDSFAEIKEFHFRGRAREVRIWDEGVMPAAAQTVSWQGLLTIAGGVEGINLANEIVAFATSIRDEIGKEVQIPDFEIKDDIETFAARFEKDSDQKAAEALYHLRGRTCLVREENRKGNVILDYVDIFPNDMAPMLILDASGKLRKTYPFWRDGKRGNLHELHSPIKRYDGLTILHWNHGAGRDAQGKRDDAEKLAREVARMIGEIPSDEDILVIHLKVRGRVDITKLIERYRPARAGKVNFLNYGRHTATNDYRDIKNVIMVGVWAHSLSAYEAMGRGAKMLDKNDEFVTTDLEAVRQGEISHHIFQAAGRGSVRKTENGGCPEGCRLYMIFSTKEGTGFPAERLTAGPDAGEEDMTVIFPGAMYREWKARGEGELKGRKRDAFEFIGSRIAQDGVVSFSEVCEALEFRKPHLSRMLADDDFRTRMEEAGYKRERIPGGELTFGVA